MSIENMTFELEKKAAKRNGQRELSFLIEGEYYAGKSHPIWLTTDEYETLLICPTKESCGYKVGDKRIPHKTHGKAWNRYGEEVPRTQKELVEFEKKLIKQRETEHPETIMYKYNSTNPAPPCWQAEFDYFNENFTIPLFIFGILFSIIVKHGWFIWFFIIFIIGFKMKRAIDSELYQENYNDCLYRKTKEWWHKELFEEGKPLYVDESYLEERIIYDMDLSKVDKLYYDINVDIIDEA